MSAMRRNLTADILRTEILERSFCARQGIILISERVRALRNIEHRVAGGLIDHHAC